LSSGTRAATVLPVVAASSAAGDFTRGLSEAGHPRRYARHARVFCEGDHSDFVLVVVEGRLKLVVTTVEGGESVLGIRGPGALVGELAAFHRGPRMATAVALEPLVTRVVAADEFRALVADQPEVGLELIGVLIGRLREADRRRLEFGNYDTLSRVARLLGDLATDQASSASDPREVRLSQAEVAGLVGASRESVARALGLLRTRGLVTTGRGTIMILDSDALLSLAG
jgi:CRP/FNR family cyclic AMP-dependent transcriptional regulator